MRQIQFRAWHIYHKFMFQVMEVTFDAQYASGFSRVVAYPFDAWNKSENEQGEWANNAPRARTHYIHHEIDNLELMQYTGLKDKNGREIYEGDIVRDHNAITLGARPVEFEVFWNDGKDHNRWDLRSAEKGRYWEYYCSTPYWDDLEVIGNIYENPDLKEEQ